MKRLMNVRVFVAVLAAACLIVLLMAVPSRSGIPAGQYDPWLDVNNDGKIDGKDISSVARDFGTVGQNITKAGLQYDSGWLNITGKQGQSITITHNLNITDWNDPNMTVDIIGKTTLDSGLLRFLGLTGQGWSRTYGGTGDDIAFSVVQTGDGGYTFAGYTTSFGAGSTDAWLVKTDANGNQLWNKTYGGTGDDEALSVVQTGDGGYALIGYTDSFGAGGYDAWLVKTDATGNMLWNKTYGGTGDDYARSLVQTGDGGFALAGWTNSFGAGSYDFWLVKTDASGNMLWNKTYGGTGDDREHSLVQTGDGGYALAGYTDSFGAGGYDFWLVKTDASGNIGESGLVWVGSTSDSIRLYRGAADPSWNYVRVQIWKRQ